MSFLSRPKHETKQVHIVIYEQGEMNKEKEQEEKNTKYFLGLEKSVKQKSSIQKIIGEHGIEIEDAKLIQSEIKTFYANRALRKISVTQFEVEQYLSSINTPSCSSEQVEMCNKEISLTEIFNVLKV